MKNYKKYLETINDGYNAPAARENMPKTAVYPTYELRYDFTDGFPILTGKTMPFYSIVAELICFIQGHTDVRAFANLGCNVWWDNAYKWNIEDKVIEMSKEDYIEFGMRDYQPNFHNPSSERHGVYGWIGYDLGRIYSAQWTDWKAINGAEINQLVNLLETVKTKPYERYGVLSAWNPPEMNTAKSSQPNCHVYYQTTCVENEHTDDGDVWQTLNNFLTDDTVNELEPYIDEESPMLFGHLTQRSCDAFLGVPFNITSYSLFTIIIGIICNVLPMGFSWVGVNNHIYANHQEPVKKYIKTKVHELPKLDIDIEAINTLEKIKNIETKEQLREIFRLEDYESSGKIPAKLSVGSKG